jgi:hypothetical protein
MTSAESRGGAGDGVAERWQLFFLPLEERGGGGGVAAFCPFTFVLGRGETPSEAMRDWVRARQETKAESRGNSVAVSDAVRLLGATSQIFTSTKVWRGVAPDVHQRRVAQGEDDVFIIELGDGGDTVLVRPKTGLVRTVGAGGLIAAGELDNGNGCGDRGTGSDWRGRTPDQEPLFSFSHGARPCPPLGEDVLAVPPFLMDERIMCTAPIWGNYD